MTRELKDADSNPPSPNVLRAILALRWWGWVGFWGPLVLGVIAAITLLFSGVRAPGTVPGAATNPGTLPGLGFVWAGLVVLAGGIAWSFRYTQVSQKLRQPERPSRAQIVQMLKIGIGGGLLGIFLTLIGSFSIVGSLYLKASQFGGTIGATVLALPVQSIDLFAIQATSIVLLAHYISLCTSLWLLNRFAEKAG